MGLRFSIGVAWNCDVADEKIIDETVREELEAHVLSLSLALRRATVSRD